MAFFQNTFLGASVQGFNSSIGWNAGTPSQLSVQLVEDPVNGDVFTPGRVGTPSPGQPVHFQFEGFRFSGLLQQWEKKNDVNGLPTWEVVCVDPREVLEGAQIITGGYNGSVGGLGNLFNAYGYWENNGGYGASLSNETGMPWPLIRDAVVAMVNSANPGDYGGPLTFRGFRYSLDLRQLPTPPNFYRIPGPSVSLLDVIAQVCEDGGCDFFVDLAGFSIVIRTVSRLNPPPLGTISALTNANWGGTVRRSNNGVEVRNETTSSFLVGGEVTDLHQTDVVESFWGYDILGNPIIGVPGVYNLVDAQGHLLQSVPTDLALLNASPVSDVLGSVVYACTTLEMRLALVNAESWSAFMVQQRPDISTLVGITNQFKYMAVAGALDKALKPNFVNDDPKNAKALAIAAIQTDKHIKQQRLYEFVRGYASEYMGRKFVVPLPFLLQKIDPDTLRVTNSYDVTDGGYLPEHVAPLGLTKLNQDVFRNQDDRFRAFVAYDGIAGADLSKVSPRGTVIQGNTLYVECQVDTRVILIPTPCAVVTVPSQVFEEAVDAYGDFSLVAAVLQKKPADVQDAFKRGQFGNIPMKVAPATRSPDAAAVALKSNILTYGPWFVAGAPGKVRFEQDQSLTPWAYGGYDAMNLAGNCRVATSVTNMQLSETGTLELAAAPSCSLGDLLRRGGPEVTNINVSYGKDGVTTSYRWQTYTPRYGIFAKGAADRIRRLGTAGQDLRRSLRASVAGGMEQRQAVADAARTTAAWVMTHAPKAIKNESPYDVFIGYNVADARPDVVPGSGDIIRVGVSTATLEEAVVLANADSDSEYKNTAVMSWSGLIRPFSTFTSPSGQPLMSQYTFPTVFGDVPTKLTLDPWKQFNDVEAYAWGDTYTGLHAQRRRADGTNARVFALRGPLVVSGWGYDVACKQTPSGTNGVWDNDLTVRSDKWKTGPVDLLWDEPRGVWTCHGSLKGTTADSIASLGDGRLNVAVPIGSGYSVPVRNYFHAPIASGVRCIVNYVPTDNIYFIVAADC